MSYDPIHDTYVPSKESSSLTSTNDSSKSQNINNIIDSNVSGNVFDVNHGGSALSISHLVSSQQQEPSLMVPPKINTISSLINTPPEINEDENDNDDDYNDETDVNSTILGDDDEYTSTPPPKNKEKKEKKPTNRRGKKKNNIANAKLSLKKSDGEPFWRKDIQYDFLSALFDDPTPCFTNVFPHSSITNCNDNPKISFGELYVRTLAESNKCSRVLKEKLIRDFELGKAVSMVCILVNVGRMNTTINFVPEMKSTLRTFHSIPSLQTGPEGGTVKQLQDTPRLKSILKAVCEGEENNLGLLDELMKNPPAKKPNTNLIQLLFLLSNSVNDIPYMNNDPNCSHLLHLFVDDRYDPKNRAQRLLWLLYTYLETSFTVEELAQNPFGANQIPPPILIPQDQLESFDKDPVYEIVYADEMYKLRMQHLAGDNDAEKETTQYTNKKESKKREREKDHEDGRFQFTESETIEEKKKKIKPHQLEFEQLQKQFHQQLQKEKQQENKQQETIQVQQPINKKVKKNNPNVASPLSRNVINRSEEENQRELKGIKFPIENLAIIKKEFNGPIRAHQSTPDSSESVSHRCELVELSKHTIHEVRTSSKASTASFNKKTTILGNWLYRYFRYKKSIGNKLLGMEWEDIRYELIKNVEGYMYENFGKSLIDEFDDLQFDYFVLGDYDKANEKKSYILQLITFLNEWFISRLEKKFERGIPRSYISFDLENETVSI
ncbi:unnamed protein product [Candida verbasci]|uniref:Ino eighty subunit 1 n=1 Tax=Candida verbasci TaxID=1227364 RepID=A0A9W4XBX1_9ASCO|nr:unnamed protein product [Candida verbasci]